MRCCSISESARVPLGVVTNGPTELQWAKVRNTGVADLVDAVVVSGEFGVNKPHPFDFRSTRLDRIGAMPIGDAVCRRQSRKRTSWARVELECEPLG